VVCVCVCAGDGTHSQQEARVEATRARRASLARARFAALWGAPITRP
jgi:hypothetical protein